MYIVTAAQMQAAEKAANEAGLSYTQMMENAGERAALALEQTFDLYGAQVLILVGPGNNGGDGLVMARHLSYAGATVAVYVWRRGELAADPNWQALEQTNVSRIVSDEADSAARLTHLLDNAALVVDALLGTGVTRPISGDLATLLAQTKQTIEQRRQPHEGLLVQPNRPNLATEEIGPVVIGVDLPSGLNSDTGVADAHTLPADVTITFDAPKRGHIVADGPNVTGQLIVADIDLTPQSYPAEVTLQMVTAAQVASLLPPRPATAHKGTFGRVLILAGSTHYTGAPLLAAQAAIRSGVGWAMLACPEEIYPILATRLTEATFLPLAEGLLPAADLITRNLTRATAMLVGPGLGQAASTVELVRHCLLTHQAAELPPLVVDADGLNILAQHDAWWTHLPPNSILTPHPGEMARLTGLSTQAVQAERLDVATEMAVKWGQVVLLKGAYTIIADPSGQATVLPFANPALAKAGSGDVLAGMIVAWLAQGVPPQTAAVIGGYLHGLTGVLAREELGAVSVTAGDLIEFLPSAVRELGLP